MEISIIVLYWLELVVPCEEGNLAGDGGVKAQARLEAVNRGWGSMTRQWHCQSSSRSRAATTENGRRLANLVIERQASFPVRLSEGNLADRFPYRHPAT